MMVIARLVEICIEIAATTALLVVIAATIYDMLSVIWQHRLEAARHTLRHHRLPEVTYLVHITTSTDELKRCLDQIRHSYRHYDCVVVVESQVPATVKQMARQTVAGRSDCRLYIRRKPASLSATLTAAYQRSQHGEYVMFVRPDHLLNPVAMRRALAWCRVAPHYGGIRFASIDPRPVTMATIVSLWSRASGQLGAKAMALHWSSGLSPGLYRQAAFRQYCQGKRIVTLYRADVVVKSTRQPHSNLLMFFTGLALWLVALYSCIAAATLLSAWPLLTSWAIVCAWLVAGVWFDGSLSFLRKIDLTVCIPFGYFALFCGGIVSLSRRLVRGRAI